MARGSLLDRRTEPIAGDTTETHEIAAPTTRAVAMRRTRFHIVVALLPLVNVVTFVMSELRHSTVFIATCP